MDKSVYNPQRRRLTSLLKTMRQEVGLSQSSVAATLGVSLSFVTEYENGERSLDLLELRHVCDALESSLTRFVERFEQPETP